MRGVQQQQQQQEEARISGAEGITSSIWFLHDLKATVDTHLATSETDILPLAVSSPLYLSLLITKTWNL